MGYGGPNLRGSFEVRVDGKAVFAQSDTWISADGARRQCEKIALLLQEAFDRGKGKKAPKKEAALKHLP